MKWTKPSRISGAIGVLISKRSIFYGVVALCAAGFGALSSGVLFQKYLYCVVSENPDWAAIWTMRWTAALAILAALSFIAAGAAAWYAKLNVDTIRETERIKRTEYEARRLEGAELIDAFNSLIAPRDSNLIAKRKSTELLIATDDTAKAQADKLLDYFSWLATLQRYGLVDKRLLVDRIGPLAIMTYCVLESYIQTYETLKLNEYDDLKTFVHTAITELKARNRVSAILSNIEINKTGAITYK